MCSCGEGKFVRTDKVFRKGDVHELFIPNLLAPVGRVCTAPMTHDCAYINLRNRLDDKAGQMAALDCANVKDDVERARAMDRMRPGILKELLSDHYAAVGR